MVDTINDALDLIYSLVDYSMTHAKDISNDVFSLDSIRTLLFLLGNPQNSYPIIHTAGTKGKGSVCAMLASALQNAGYKTGLYTSPHLIKFNERIMINGKMISDDEIVSLTNRIMEKTTAMDKHVSTFEFTTAMAFEFFKEQKVDFAVFETGLGGRLDATNVVDPVLTIITSVSLDHTVFLGNTIQEIASEKAGIIKENVPVICGCQPYREAVQTIKDTATKKNSPWISVSDRYHFINQRNQDAPDSMIIWRVEDQSLMEKRWISEQKSAWEPTVVPLALKGAHQLQNAASVFAAINKLKSVYNQLDIEKACEGIGKTFWPCRFELLSETKPLIVDGAHNVDSVRKLSAALERYYGSQEITCIFGASEDKALIDMIKELAPHVNRFIMTCSTHPRAADPEQLALIAASMGRENIVADTLEDAYSIYENDSNKDACYVAAGSLFVAGGIRELYMNKHDSVRYFG